MSDQRPERMQLFTLESILRERIKPELNRLYTEPPTLVDDCDWGWFCREHSLHTYFLAKLLGFQATIRRGDFIGKLPSGGGISSTGSSSDHVWCQIDSVVPVDLSANFEHYGDGFPWIHIVFGAGDCGESFVAYNAANFDNLDSQGVARPILAYRERGAVSHADKQLLDDPYSFLNPGEWGEQFGRDIFNKITLHLFDVARGVSERVLTKGVRIRTALETFQGRYPDATETIKQAIACRKPDLSGENRQLDGSV